MQIFPKDHLNHLLVTDRALQSFLPPLLAEPHCSMGWWEGVDEPRVLIAPDPGVTEDNSGRLLLLCHPKSGNASQYLFVNGVLQELQWFKNSYGSWFLGEYVYEVFSQDAWRCVWRMIQNDLVHGWVLYFALRKCVELVCEKKRVVDSQWIVHQGVASLRNQGEAQIGKSPWSGVRERCRKEWTMFQSRLTSAENEYYKSTGSDPSNFTAH